MPRRDTTEGILAKFSKVGVSDELNISEADLGYCERKFTQYTEAIKRISDKEAKIKELSDELGHPNQTLDFARHGKRYKEVQSQRQSSEDNYNHYDVSLIYALKYAYNQKADLEHKFVSDIIRYFEAEYNLNIKNVDGWFLWDENKNEHKEPIHYAPIVRAIIKECGTFDLKDIGIDRIKESFRNLARYQERIKIGNKKISISQVYYWSDYSWRATQWDYSDSRLIDTIKGLTLFETGKVNEMDCPELQKQFAQPVQFSDPYVFESYSKVLSMKVFKNGRVDFNFDSKASLYEFYDFFEFSKLEEKW